MRLAKVFDMATELFAFLPELIKKIFEGWIAQPAADGSSAYEVCDFPFLLIQARDTEAGFDNALRILDTELTRVSAKVVCNAVQPLMFSGGVVLRQLLRQREG